MKKVVASLHKVNWNWADALVPLMRPKFFTARLCLGASISKAKEPEGTGALKATNHK